MIWEPSKRRQCGPFIAAGGKAFSRGHLYSLLSNPIYIGQIVHKSTHYQGQHDPIIDQDLWDSVQAQLKANATDRISPTNLSKTNLLDGIVFDETGDRLAPSHANKKGKRYRYYVSNRLTQGNAKQRDGWRLPAQQLEDATLSILCDHLSTESKLAELIGSEAFPADVLPKLLSNADRLSNSIQCSSSRKLRRLIRSILDRVDIDQKQLILHIDRSRLSKMLEAPTPNPNELDHNSLCIISATHTLKRRGVETRLVLTSGKTNKPNPEQHLIAAIAQAHHWLEKLTSKAASSIDDLASQENADRNEISRYLPLASLAPDIIEKILEGNQPADLTAMKLLRRGGLSHYWHEQRQILGFRV